MKKQYRIFVIAVIMLAAFSSVIYADAKYLIIQPGKVLGITSKKGDEALGTLKLRKSGRGPML